MEMHRCYKCFREYPAGEEVCTCGNRHGAEEQPHYALHCGQILNGKYIVGKVLGQGGFGITYVGFDLVLEKKVAIKEYFPVNTGAVSRNLATGELIWYEGSVDGISKEAGYKSCLREARKMAKVEEIPGVVSVRDLFEENNTAYIVMSFIEGTTLKQMLKQQGNMTFAQCVETLSPVLQALDRVNAEGIIHRDISPDNIMLTPNGTAWVLDMGAAKDLDSKAMSAGIGASSQLTVKAGFSPPEQYMTSDKIGSWTDVYAMSATIFYCVTGNLPPLAPDRMFNDPLTILPPLTQPQFDVLKAGMGFDPAARIQTMAELHARLQAVLNTAPVTEPIVPVVLNEPEVIKTEPAVQKIKPEPAPAVNPVRNARDFPRPGSAAAAKKPGKDHYWLILLLALVLIMVGIVVTLVIQYRKAVNQTQLPAPTEVTETTSPATSNDFFVIEPVETAVRDADEAADETDGGFVFGDVHETVPVIPPSSSGGSGGKTPSHPVPEKSNFE